MSRIWSSPWTVAVIALLIGIIVLARGGFGTPAGMKAGIAIVGLLLVGFLWPPLGILIGGVALFYLVFVHGPQLLAQLTQSTGSTTNG
ncbi:MAG TPA: hypothetical protein VNH17_21045 [Streptosporangiaceae bacterium]|nr:hypothetical protein [Streptosporangiaceae bacterium]